MSDVNLKNLEKIGKLKSESFDQDEFDGLVRSGKTRLKDANNTSLAQESRFDLAYNAAHSLALAALRKHGYRSSNRYVVFQALPHTIGLADEYTRILDRCHNLRNVAEYEGILEINDKLLEELIKSAQVILDKVNFTMASLGA
jgi:uncharacterized protein (UPF0332 family)